MDLIKTNKQTNKTNQPNKKKTNKNKTKLKKKQKQRHENKRTLLCQRQNIQL